MIKRVKGGYQVFSESGKALSRPGMRRAEAEERLKQVEYFKNLRKEGKKPKEGK